jgi:acetolactate synthase-1/2/3 large subunit
MRLADYITQRCVDAGARHTFLVTGGGAMHLNDAFGRHPDMTPVCFHHEQAAAMAAESYYRINNQLCVLNVTTGPGGINALNGVFGAYVDSQAMIVVSGQVKLETYYKQYPDIKLRQLGDQEVDIVSMARPVVKYIKLLDHADQIKQIMDKAIYLATSGRPGPVWIDVPVDISSKEIDVNTLQGWDGNLEELLNDPAVTENTRLELQSSNHNNLETHYHYIVEKLKTAQRPVLFAGSGIRISNQYNNFIKLIEKLGIPVVTGWNAHDVLPNSSAYYAGRPGTVGDRAGNFAVQNSDLLIVLGSRLNIRQVSYNHKNFASGAYKIQVDIDKAELDKPTLHTDYKIVANLADFIPGFLKHLDNYTKPYVHQQYLEWCQVRVSRYPTVLPEYQHKHNLLNPYLFVNELIEHSDSDACIVTGNGSACVISFQTAKIKSGQRLFTNSGNASMGYDLPAAIGACLANRKQSVICLAGDGSIMMNLQELQTVAGYNLPIKIIILNNNGYLSIKQTQNNYFSDNVFGTGPDNGVSIPDFVQVGTAFGINSYKITNIDEWRSDTIQYALVNHKPVLIEVMLDPDQNFSPKLAAKKLADGSMLAPSLENMSPFLSDEEMSQNKL